MNRCFFCDKKINLVTDRYFRSVTHQILMHLKCFIKYEKLINEGKIKQLYDKEELQSLSDSQ